MNKKIKGLFILSLLGAMLTSCFKTAKDLITTGDYYFNKDNDPETTLVLKEKNFQTTKPDTYQLELLYFHLNISELTLEEYEEYSDVNKQSKTYTLFSPQDEYIYFRAVIDFQLCLFTYKSDDDLEPTSEVKKLAENVYGTYIGRYNHQINTYYFLLDYEDPCYEDIAHSGQGDYTLLLLSLRIEQEQKVQVRLSSRTGSLYGDSERWNKTFDLEYNPPEEEEMEEDIPVEIINSL